MSSFTRKMYGTRIDSNDEQILSLDFYQHKAVMQAIQGPFKSLESGKFNDGLITVSLSAYILEKFAWASGLLDPENSEYKEFLDQEKQKNLNDGLQEKEMLFKTRISYSKIAYILKLLESRKATKTEYKV